MREKTGENVVADLSDLDLHNVDFTRLKEGATAFADAGVNPSDKNEAQRFCDCLERGLRGVSFAGMDQSRAKMSGCDLRGAKLPRSIVRTATDGARFDPAQKKQMERWAMDELAQKQMMVQSQ